MKFEDRICDWATAHPQVRRVWIFGTEALPPANGQLHIAVQVQPVADSEETLPRILANGEKWRTELASAIGSEVAVQWLDPDEPAAPSRGQLLVYERTP